MIYKYLCVSCIVYFLLCQYQVINVKRRKQTEEACAALQTLCPTDAHTLAGIMSDDTCVMCLSLQVWRAVLGLIMTFKEKVKIMCPPFPRMWQTEGGTARCRARYSIQCYMYLPVGQEKNLPIRHLSPPKNQHSHAHSCKSTTNVPL